jgi:hypothetical protein
MTGRTPRPLDLGATGSRLVSTNTARLLLLLFAVVTASYASVTVEHSDQNGVSFRYVPGKARLAGGVGGRDAVDFDDADHVAQTGEPDLPGKVVRVGIPQTGGILLSVRTGPEHVLHVAQPPTVPHMSWDGDSSWCDGLPADGPVFSRRAAETGREEVLRGVRFVPAR